MEKNQQVQKKTGVLSSLLVGIAGIAIGFGAKFLADEYLFKKDKDEKEKVDEELNRYYNIDSSNEKTFKTDEGYDEYESFLCPIGQEIMNDPVITPKGITYERNNILNWLKKSQICPITKTPLNESDLIKNYSLKNAIMEYIKKQDFKNQ